MQIAVGVDLRVEGHDWLLERAGWYARRMGARVDLVFVTHEDGHRPRLEAMLATLPVAIQGTARVAAGDPEDTLVEMSGSYDAMVLGPREPGAIERFLKGTMAVRVLRRSQCPVLVPRLPSNPTTAVRLLVGVDLDGDIPHRIIEWTAMWAGHLDGVVDALYAMPQSLPPTHHPAARAELERTFEQTRDPERKRLAELLETLPEHMRGEGRVKRGEVEDVLVEMSRLYQVVVVGNRERQGLGRLIIGNVAHHVVRNASCDVLVLPTAVNG